MARFSRLLLGLCATPLLASCVFLLDYDELQGGKAAAEPGAGGATAGGTGNVGAEGGASGAGCGDCDDRDPCTVDTCDETGDAPECLHELGEGLKLDGIDEVFEAEQHLRVSLVAGTDVFYLAALEANDEVTEVNLYRLTRDGDALEPVGGKLSTVLPPESSIVSNLGMAIDPTLGLAVHGFVAIQPLVGGAKVFHLVHRNGNTEGTLLLNSSYSAHSPWVFPQALAIGNAVVGAWIQEDGTIAVQEAGDLTPPNIFGDIALPATTLSLLSTDDDRPAVMFTSQTGDTLGAYVESPAHTRAAITECQTAPGNYLSSGVISTQIPGLWLNNITRAGDDYLTSGGATLACGSLACLTFTDECDPEQDLANNLRNVAGATIAADVTGVVYSVIALPQLTLKMGSTTQVEGKLSVSFGRVDFNSMPAQSTTIGGDEQGLMELSRQDTDESVSFAGPDWPAVGILPSQQVAIAWIQPNAARSGTELRVQRYKMCLPAE
jgi:hypothetical protein